MYYYYNIINLIIRPTLRPNPYKKLDFLKNSQKNYKVRQRTKQTPVKHINKSKLN
jgi:hypothetical protein